MTAPSDLLDRYRTRGWCVVPVHRPHPDTGRCSCGRDPCPNPGKHPDARYWPGGTADRTHFTGRNVGVQLGPVSANLADVDKDCWEAVAAGTYLLPPTPCSFGRGGLATHDVYVVADGAASFARLVDPVLPGSQATIVELRWPERNADGGFKAVQTVFPPSLHCSGDHLEWFRDGEPAPVAGADLAAAVRHVGAAVLVARYARPRERHALVLLLANLLVRAGWADDARVVAFVAAVFAARNDPDKVAKVMDGEGRGAVQDARKRLREGKPMTGLPALREMLDPTLPERDATKVVDRVREWLGLPEPVATQGNGNAARATGQSPAPPIPPYVPFPTHLLPPVPRAYVEATAAAMNCDPSYSALPVLAALGAAIGSSHVASPKKIWKEPPYVWALPIGRSGAIKSPPYRDVEDLAEDINDRLEREYEVALAAYESQVEEWGERRKAAREGGDDPGPRPKPPAKRSFIKGDVTIEALVGTLQDNPRGLFIGQDELSAWIGGFVKYAGKTGASDLPRWLQLSNAGSVNYTRKTGDRKEVRIRGVGVSVAGTIQPKVLARVLNEEFRASGFLARLLLAMPPWRKRLWTEAEVDEPVRDGFAALLNELHGLPGSAWPDGRPRPHLVRLTDEAKALFVAFYNANGAALETADEDMSAVMSKLEGYALRFALIFHCCRLKEYAGQARITGDDMAAAIRLTVWFRDEAERVYLALGETPEMQAARLLGDVMVRLASKHGGLITPRQLVRSNSRKYPTAAAAEAVLESLVGRGLGRWVDVPPGPNGGPSTRAFAPRMTHDTTPEDQGEGVGCEGDSQDGLHDTTLNDADRPSELADHGRDVNPVPLEASDESGGSVREVVSVVSCVMRGVQVVEEAAEEGGESPDRLCHANGVVSCKPILELPSLPGATRVDDAGQLGPVVAAVEDSGGPVGVDTETTGLDPRTDRVRLLQVATDRGTFVIDLFALPDPRAALAPLFEVLGAVEVVGHNLLFDLRFLAPLGFVPEKVFDTLLASRVLHAGEREEGNARIAHGLGDVAARELGRTLDKTQQQADWSRALTPDMLAYAATDAAVLLPLAESLRAKLAQADLTATAALEMRALPGIAWSRPLAVDAVAWTALAHSAREEVQRLDEEMAALAPNPQNLFGGWNWNSPEQVRAAFASAGIDLTSTGDDVLAGIDHPLARRLRDYRGATKRAGTYGQEWLKKHVGADGRVLPSWNPLGAESGRMSCSDPNLQQVPRGSDYRRCFVAGPGHVLVKADYSQVELRIAAKVASEGVMVQAYRDGRDLHRLTATRVLGKPEEELSKDDRQVAKSLNFGLLYGMGWRGLKGYARANYGVALTDAQARDYRDAFFRTYPGLRAWHRQEGDKLDRLFRANPEGTHEVRTLAGRRRVLSVSKRRADGTPYPNVTDALNTPVQGTGADGLKRAIARLWETRSECPSAVPVVFCHDEIVLEVPEADTQHAAKWLRACMVEAVAPLIDPVPVEVEVSIGATWGG